MFKLLIESEKSARSSIPVRWCISSEMLMSLKGKNPYVLIAVSHIGIRQEFTEICRYLVPFKKMMEYVNFDRPGHHTISAAVIDIPEREADPPGYRRRIEYIFEKHNYGYERNLVNSYAYEGSKIGELNIGRLSNPIFCEVSTVEVDVASEFFAKEPPELLKRWGNFWYERAPRDECQFRRRLILAFTLQPILVPIWGLLKIGFRLPILLWQLLFGLRDIKFAVAFRPFKYETRDFYHYCGKSYFYKNKVDEDRPVIVQCLVPIIPVTMFLILMLARWIGPTNIWPQLKMWQVVLFSFIPSLAMSSACYLVRGISKIPIPDSVINRFKITEGDLEKYKEKENIKKRDKELAKTKAFVELYEPLLCTYAKDQPISVSALPKSRKTVHLRFLDLKARVCRQFANSGR
jgi:hypothetical protein